jgi:hypothetical protein
MARYVKSLVVNENVLNEVVGRISPACYHSGHLPHCQNFIEKLPFFFYSCLGEADLIKQHLRKNSFRAALNFNTNLSFAEKILLLTAKTQMEA